MSYVIIHTVYEKPSHLILQLRNSTYTTLINRDSEDGYLHSLWQILHMCLISIDILDQDLVALDNPLLVWTQWRQVHWQRCSKCWKWVAPLKFATADVKEPLETCKQPNVQLCVCGQNLDFGLQIKLKRGNDFGSRHMLHRAKSTTVHLMRITYADNCFLLTASRGISHHIDVWKIQEPSFDIPKINTQHFAVPVLNRSPVCTSLSFISAQLGDNWQAAVLFSRCFQHGPYWVWVHQHMWLMWMRHMSRSTSPCGWPLCGK